MSNYLTEAAYMRWFRQYQVHFELCSELLNQLRVRLDQLPLLEEIGEVENQVYEMDDYLLRVIPRDFEEEPLSPIEKLTENVKVLVNLVQRMRGQVDKFPGIYQAEKQKILNLQEALHIKERIKLIRDRLDAIDKFENEDSNAVGSNDAELILDKGRAILSEAAEA